MHEYKQTEQQKQHGESNCADEKQTLFARLDAMSHGVSMRAKFIGMDFRMSLGRISVAVFSAFRSAIGSMPVASNLRAAI
jgi:hypothetical protein